MCKVIAISNQKGGTLIGKVEYSMDKRQSDGRDDPKYLDCSSSSGTSLTGNDSGPMFVAYTGFGYFRRFKKFE